MTVRCPHCASRIPVEDYNVSTDLAVCRRCDVSHKLSMLLAAASDASVVLETPPGAWLEERSDGFRVGATTRSIYAVFLVPFAIVWSGGAVGGTLIAPLQKGTLEPGQLLFAIPFLIGGVFVWTMVLMSLFGRREVSVNGDEATLFVGVGRLGWRRRFRWTDIVSVDEVLVRNARNSTGLAIVLQGSSSYTFGADLSEARRYFLRETLRRKLRPRAPVQPTSVEGPYRAA